MLRIERDTLAPRLRELLAQLSARAAAQHAASPRAQRLAVLLGVAHALASSEDVPSAAPSIGAPTVRAAVERILATIAVATTSEANIHELADLQLRELDLSELEPRSHYDREGLRGFFRAVMWLSRARLEDAGAALDVYRWLGRGALRRSYSDIYQLYELFVGPAEDGSLMTVAAMEAEQPALFRGERGAIVAAAEARLGGPSALPSAEGANAHRKRFYLFPARLTPDAEVMQSLSFSGRARSTRKPSALDVMAVLGSSRAALHASEQQGFPFDATVAKLRGRALFGHEGSYGTWLAALQTMLVDGAGVHATSAHDGSAALPAFARTTAYRDKLLHTALASYAALKHDTLLATKPPRVRMGGVQHSDEWLVEHLVMPRALIYVEPTPGLYEQLARYTERIEAAMRAIGPDATAAQRRFARLRAELVRPLQEALERQLRHEPLDDALHAELATIAHWLRSNWYAEGGGALIGPDRPTGGPCLVADIWSSWTAGAT
jgi:hypothetical protein